MPPAATPRNLQLAFSIVVAITSFVPAGGTAPAFWPFLKTHIFHSEHAHLTLRHWVGGGGDVNVHVNLRLSKSAIVPRPDPTAMLTQS